jgi:O-antigen/teichoic acid export membrane protein
MSMLFSSQEISKAYQFFIGRQALSMALSFGSAVLIARQIGPTAYGAYFICTTGLEYLVQACQFGIPPFLYREKPQNFNQGLNLYFTFVLGLSLLISALIFLGLFFFKSSQLETIQAAKWLIFSLPLFLANTAFRISLEKELKSKEIASAEIAAHLVFLTVGGALAYLQKGVWAPVIAWWAQNLTLLFSLISLSSYRPIFGLHRSTLNLMLKSGAPVVGVSLISGLEGLTLSFITTDKLGISSTGELGLVRKIISRASFLQGPNTRLSNIVCGNHVADTLRLKSFISANLFGNTLAFGILFVLLAWTPNFIFEKILGEQWKSSFTLLPWLCFSTFTTSSLYVLQATLISLEAHRTRFFLAIASLISLILCGVLLIPQFGITGWAMAEASASLVSLFLIFIIQSKLGPFAWRKTLAIWFLLGTLILLRGLI